MGASQQDGYTDVIDILATPLRPPYDSGGLAFRPHGIGGLVAKLFDRDG